MRSRIWLALLILVGLVPLLRAEEAVTLAEKFAAGDRHRVRIRVDLSGSMTAPAAKGKIAKKLELEGSSAIDYEERLVAVESGKVSKTVRGYEKLDFRRTLAGQSQQLALRPGVRRLVILRKGHTEVPFSPDGPLTWGEMDVVRTDVFVPGLSGLFPTKAVLVGDRWSASASSVKELTDLEKIDEGTLECKLERVSDVGKRRLARVTFTGTIRGVGEDGPVRHRLQGNFHFDLGSNHLADLTLIGTTTMIGNDGKEAGTITGRFVMTRELGGSTNSLGDAGLKGVKLDPDDDNTQMLYEDTTLGVRFLHSRRWRVAQVMGSQVALAAADGSGVLITVDPSERVPTAAAFMDESRAWLVKQKAKQVRTYNPRRLRDRPTLDAFALEAQLGEQKLWMDYYITAQAGGGATIAARIIPADLAAIHKEVDRIARSVTITKQIPAGKASK